MIRPFKLFVSLGIAGVIFLSVCPAGALQSPHPGATDKDLDQLKRGEVVVKTAPDSLTRQEMIQASVLIGAPAERVWTIMNDCGRAPRFIPGLQACRVLEVTAEGDTIEHRVRYSWYPS